jgi:hypothetical protein
MTEQERKLLEGLLVRIQKVRYGRAIVSLILRDFEFVGWEIEEFRERQHREDDKKS